MSNEEIDKLREERIADSYNDITFEIGDEVVCVYANGTSNLKVGILYKIVDVVDDKIHIHINSGKGYISEYKNWRFAYRDIKVKLREIKIDSIV